MGTGEKASPEQGGRVKPGRPLASETLEETHLQRNGRSRKIYLPVMGETEERYLSQPGSR